MGDDVLVFSSESNNWEPESITLSSTVGTLSLATAISSPSYTIQDVLEEIRKRPTKLENCDHCGGSVDNNGYCRYCGSRVYLMRNEAD